MPPHGRDQQAVELLDSHLGRRSSTHDLHQFRPRYEIRDPISGQHDAVARCERHFGTIQRAELFAYATGPHRPYGRKPAGAADEELGVRPYKHNRAVAGADDVQYALAVECSGNRRQQKMSQATPVQLLVDVFQHSQQIGW